jgi:glutamate transport system permease protein
MFVLALPPLGINLPVFWKITIPVILCNIALLAEVFRAGVLALPRGQSEAALAVGLSYWQSMRLVVMPQALRIVLPALVTQLVSLLKDSTLGFAASFPELMKTAENISARYQNFLPAYLVIALVFIAINLALSYFARALERFLARGRRGSVRERDEVEAMESIEGDLPNLTMR